MGAEMKILDRVHMSQSNRNNTVYVTMEGTVTRIGERPRLAIHLEYIGDQVPVDVPFHITLCTWKSDINFISQQNQEEDFPMYAYIQVSKFMRAVHTMISKMPVFGSKKTLGIENVVFSVIPYRGYQKEEIAEIASKIYGIIYMMNDYGAIGEAPNDIYLATPFVMMSEISDLDIARKWWTNKILENQHINIDQVCQPVHFHFQGILNKNIPAICNKLSADRIWDSDPAVFYKRKPKPILEIKRPTLPNVRSFEERKEAVKMICGLKTVPAI